MTDGISALEGFDYQAMVALELMLEHFEAHGTAAQARPEGIEDLDLEHRDGQGIVHRILVQIKKPRQNADGLRTPKPWSLRDALDALLTPRWVQLQEERTQVWWVLGDALGDDTKALLGSSYETAIWAARRAAAEWVVRAQQLPALTTVKAPAWESPFRGGGQPDGSPDDARQRWTDSFKRRADNAGFDAIAIAHWMKDIDQTHAVLDRVLQRVVHRTPYAEALELRDRLTSSLSKRFGLDQWDVRDVVFRNLRGFVDDVARSRGTWIDLRKLEDEISSVWPRRVATVLPPPLPKPHHPRLAWVSELAGRGGAVVGPSGSGKTTSATELFHHLRKAEPDMVVLYAEVRSDTAWRNVLEGVAFSIGRRGSIALYNLLPSIRAGDDEALIKIADALEDSETRVALLVDLIDGTASETLIRDLARFAQRLPPEPKTRLWVFGQEDALAELSDAERTSRRLEQVSLPGLDWEEFLALAGLHGVEDRSSLYSVYEALTSGRNTGVPPRVADAVLRLGSVESALAAAKSDDVLLVADTTRYERLPHHAQEALGALACITHPFRVEDAEATFPSVSVKAGIRAGLRVGLLHPLGDGRTEFHETVRRNVLAQLSPAAQIIHHTRLAEVNAERGDRVLEAHHAELAGLVERAREAGRAAFFDRNTADRIALRAAARKWVSPAEIAALLRGEPNSPFGWWRALHQGLDDGTAQILIAWWREVMCQQESHNALWSVPSALVAARLDLLPELLDAVASSPGEDGHHYGASALGHALRRCQFDETVVLERFERATEDERRALADTLHYSGTPRCLARWLAHVVASDKAPRSPIAHVHLSEAHVVAIIDALPDPEPSELLVRRDWGFGAATSFLWKHREAIGAGAACLLRDAEFAPRRARVAIRLLGMTGHDELFDAARRWGRHPGDAQAVALTAPLLLDDGAWRAELAGLALAPSIDTSTRVAAYGMYVQSGEGGEILLKKLVRVSPSLERICRWTAGMSFTVRPSLFALDILLEELARKDDERALGLAGAALGRATYFADGPHAKTVAERLVPCLDIPSPHVRVPVLHALAMLRQPVAREACLKLALMEANTPIGNMAALAACASRPEHLSDVRGALEANSTIRWLLSALAVRFEAADAIPYLVEKATEAKGPWRVRHRAMLSLERLPYAPEVDDAIGCILRESALLGSSDSIGGHASDILARLIQGDANLFADLWSQGEARFVDNLASVVREQDVFFKATPEQIDTCLRIVWRAVQAGLSAGSRGSEVVASVLNDIQYSHVQSAALRVARVHNKVDVLERIMATSDAPWLVFRALVERTKSHPRTPQDAARWARLVTDGPCGADPSLQIPMRNVLQSLPIPSEQPRQSSVTDPMPPVLTVEDLHTLIDGKQKEPRRARLADMDDEALASLVARLDSKDDNLVEVKETKNDAERVSLTADGATLTAPRMRSTGRGGNRPGLRARLVARFPDRVPAAWLDSRMRGYDFVSRLVDALADEGDPGRALNVLRRLSGNVTDTIHVRSNIYRLGQIADDALVNWISGLAGAGGPAEISGLASFARQATADTVLPLLSRLMRRVEGHVAGEHAVISHEVDDPWRLAFVDLLRAKRLRDVPGAGAWLVKMLAKTRYALTREWIIEAMAAFPSTWSVVETEVLNGFEYSHRHQPTFLKAEEIAQALFHATRDGDDTAEPACAP